MAAEPFPILVGLTGKRALDGKDEVVAEALTAVFQAMDTAFPHSPKVLVTGLAEGADTVATRVALGRAGWRAIGLLPYSRHAYRASFSTDAARYAFDALLADPQLHCHELPPLRPDGADRTGSHGPEYEQLGLWLAEHATILVGVLPAAEGEGRLGGSARVIANRCRGEPDAAGEAILARSTAIAPAPLLQAPNRGSAIVIDLAGAISPAGRLPVLLRRGSANALEDKPFDPGPTTLRHMAPLAVAIDTCNRRAAIRMNDGWPASLGDTVTAANRFRSGLGLVQGRCQALWRRGILLLAGIFVLAVMMLEAFAKFTADWPFAAAIHLPVWGAGAYAMLVLGAIMLHRRMRLERWQAIHHDYRAVREVLRVQIAWWAAGLQGPDARADRHFLVGATGGLGLVRQAAAAAITWIELVNRPADADWQAVAGKKGWIDGQIAYFERQARARANQLLAVAVASWGCFFLAMGLAVCLAVYAAGLSGLLGWLAYLLKSVTPFGAAGLIVFAAAVPLLLGAGAWVGRRVRARTHAEPPTPMLVAAFCVPAGFLFLASGLYLLAPAIGPQVPGATKTLVVITMAALIAVAGAIRYVSEKLAWETEAHAYREALQNFSQARHRLQRIELLPEDARPAQREAVVRALGQAALAESEAWLRAHRERPAEPVVA